jgi:hypothetical protein
MTAICPQCGKPVLSDAYYCGYCGGDLPLPVSSLTHSHAKTKVNVPWKRIGLIGLPVLAVCILIGWIAFFMAGGANRFLPSNSPSAKVLAQPVMENTTRPVDPQPVQTIEPIYSLSDTAVVQPAKVNTPVPTKKPASVSKKLPDPADFIRKYFDSLNNRDYKIAWSRLSGNFIDGMSQKVGYTYTYEGDYAPYWDTVAQIDVIEAKTESKDTKSASVSLKLRWNMNNGESKVHDHLFYLIKDPHSNSWLIDVTETLN